MLKSLSIKHLEMNWCDLIHLGRMLRITVELKLFYNSNYLWSWIIYASFSDSYLNFGILLIAI